MPWASKPKTVLVEILPGIFADWNDLDSVPKRFPRKWRPKKTNMLTRGQSLETEEAKEEMRVNRRGRRPGAAKYSLLLLDEALKVAKEVGPTEASRQTGVSLDAIKKHSQREKLAMGIALKPLGPSKYPLPLKQKIIRNALKMQAHTGDSANKCYLRACINERLAEPKKAAVTIAMQYQKGTILI